MDLVNELQVSAEQDDVLTVLRKARRLAMKLNVIVVGNWLKSEQDGYQITAEVPNYRTIPAKLMIHATMPIPVGYGRIGSGMFELPNFPLVPIPYKQSIAELMAIWNSDCPPSLFEHVDGEVRKKLLL